MGSAVSGIASGLGGIVGGIVGNEQSRGDAGEARNAANIANQILQEIKDAPDISKPLILEKYRQQGILTPEMEQQISVGDSRAAQAKGSPEAQKAQLDALRQISERAAGGLSAADRAALNEVHSKVAQDTTGREKAIMSQMRAQGLGGSGAELAAKLSNAQSGANIEAEQADRLAALATQNALQAASMSGQLGGQIQGQRFGEEYQTGQAADEFRRFDIGNQVGQQQRNVGAGNAAQQYNLNMAQNIDNANVSQQNQELYNQLNRQMQEAEYNRQNAQIKSGGRAGQSQYLADQAQRTAQGAKDMGTGIGGMVGNLVGGFASPAAAAGSGIPKGGFGTSKKGLDDFSKWAPEAGFAEGGMVHDYREGGEVPGQAKVPGDHPANDTVPAMLSPGELVIPRSMAKSSLGKRLAKLLEDHHQLRKDMGE